MSVISSAGSSYSTAPPAPSPTTGLNPKTPAAGFSLINGTPNIIGLTTPNDGQMHSVAVGGGKIVTAAETGGNTVIRWVCGGQSFVAALINGAQVAGNYTSNTLVVACDPNTTVVVQQSSALTAGASTVFFTLSEVS